MEQIISFLAQLGTGIATNAIFELIKTAAQEGKSPEVLKAEIQDKIELHGIDMRADTVITALAENGMISIEGSHLHANESLIFGSIIGTAVMGPNTELSTNKTSMKSNGGARLSTQGNAQVVHNPDGSISFLVGK